MTKSSLNKVTILAFFYSTITGTSASQPVNVSLATTPFPASYPQVYSKLSAEQVKEKVNSRAYLSSDFGRMIDTDLTAPGKSWPSFSYIGYEYFPSPKMSYGFVAPYTYEKEKYSRVNANQVIQSIGVLPYFSYLATPSWLYTAEAGIFSEDQNYTQFNVTPVYKYRSQVLTHQVGGYVTWIGPQKTFTGTLRGGMIYSNQRYKNVTDSDGIFYSANHFENTAASVSSRLKYFPSNDVWNVFLHLQFDYRLIATQHRFVRAPNSFAQNRYFQIGPGMHINLNKTWEIRLMYLYTQRYAYQQENRIGIRLRAAF